MTAKTTPTSDLLYYIVEGIENVKGEDITILDFKNKENAICSYYVICNGNSNTQVKAICASIEKTLKKEIKERPYKIEGFQNSEWILLDYVSVIVHVFQKEKRVFYDIEGLWGDMKVVNLEELKIK